jgi:hypothetical protein
MPRPRQDFAAALKDKYRAGRRPEDEVVVAQPRRQMVPVAPGLGGVVLPAGRQQGDRAARSAAQFAPVTGSRFGGGSSTE